MIRASIDLGTNTCLLLIAEVAEGVVTRVILDRSTVVRLGQGVDRSHALHPDAITRTSQCLRGYASMCICHGVKPSDVVCVATATARDAENGKSFFDSVEAQFGFRFKTISGDEEARCMFQGGLLPGMEPASSAVIDIGGGSTEFRSLNEGMSFQMGSVRFTERFLKSNPVTDSEFWACQAEIDSILEGAQSWRLGLPKNTSLIGVAGTVVNVASAFLELKEFNPEALNQCTLHRGDVHRIVEELKWRTVEERRLIPGIESGREDVILAGALILWRAMERLEFETLRVSTRGLRFGVLL